jgi:hypothetical protein
VWRLRRAEGWTCTTRSSWSTELSDQVEGAVRAAAHRAGQLLFGSFPVEFVLDVSRVTSYADAS